MPRSLLLILSGFITSFWANKMAGYILQVSMENNAYAEIDGQEIQFWQGCGKADFVGTLEDFAIAFPAQMEELITAGIIKPAA